MRFAFLMQGLHICGGVRRVIETSNRLVERGHEVDILILLDNVPLTCNWLEVKADVKYIDDGSEYDVVLMVQATSWEYMERVIARLKAWWWLGFEAGYYKKQSWYDAYQQPFFILANSPFTASMAEIIYGKRPPVILGGINREHFHPVEVEKEYELLCCAPKGKYEKGWFEMKRAADILELPLENYATKGLAQEELAKEYSKAKIFIAMPHIEGAHNPPLEAMACGVPVIVSDCGGIYAYAKNEENCLIIPRHVGALIKAIKRLRGDVDLQKKFIKDGLETAKGFTWKKCADDFEKVIKKAYEQKMANL